MAVQVEGDVTQAAGMHIVLVSLPAITGRGNWLGAQYGRRLWSQTRVLAFSACGNPIVSSPWQLQRCQEDVWDLKLKEARRVCDRISLARCRCTGFRTQGTPTSILRPGTQRT